jgi:hypothetical protein
MLRVVGLGPREGAILPSSSNVVADADDTAAEPKPVLLSHRFLGAGLQQQCWALATGIVESYRIRRMIRSPVAEQRSPELGEYVRSS